MKEKKIAGMIALLALILIIIIELFSYKEILRIGENIGTYNTGWQWKKENGEQEAVTLPASLKLPSGSALVLENQVPEDFPVNGGIVFRSRQQEAEVYMDGKLIYSYPSQKLLGGAIPSHWNFVRLPRNCQGKELVIKVTSPYKGFSGGMEEIYYGNYSELFLYILGRQIPVFTLSLLVGIAGAAVILLALIFHKYHLHTYQEMQGMTMVCVSLWLCGESRMPGFFLGIETPYYVTIIALLLLPIFLYAYLHARWKEQQAQLTKALFYLSIVTAGAILALKASGTWEFIEMLAPMHILVATALAYTIWMYVKAFRKNPENVLKPELFCMILIAAGGMADLIAFYSGAEIRVGTFVRITVLIYALNLFRICILITYRGLRERAELERQLQKSRVELMTSQIQPHFIYNTLNSIRTLIKVDPEAAYQTTYDFSNYLRGNLNSMEGREKIPFSEELRHIQAYVNIEKIRFEDRIQVEFLLETRSFQVPALSVQPLVENAIKHGLCKKIEGGTVWVRSYETADSYVVEVEDNGIGFDINALENQNTEHTSIGLNNIRFRVTALSGGDMEIKSSPGEGARVTLRFPRKKREV